jgi:signal transduction histidine kinase
MSFRTRLLIAFAAATLVSLTVLGVGVRRQLTTRLVAEHQARVESLARAAIQDLARQNVVVAARLNTLGQSLADDNRFRSAVRGEPADRAYLLDWAAGAMRLAGLSMLQLQDSTGRILSSGQFRNEFDRVDSLLPRLLARTGDSLTVVSVRMSDGRFLALAREDTLSVAGRHLMLIGGVAIDRALLARLTADSAMTLSLVTPDGTISSDSVARGDSGSVSADERLAYIGESAGSNDSTHAITGMNAGEARLVVSHSDAELAALRADVDRWFMFALGAAAVVALLLAAWMSAGLSRPIAALSKATSTIALEGPELELASDRDDEIGALARRFGAMGRRLRASAAKLRDAERRATVGEMARQVNHDIKNGLIPIRNVVQHLSQVQEHEPAQLATVFAERRSTLESSIRYLDTLARNYARLTPTIARRSFDAGAVAREAAGSASNDGVAIQVRIAGALPPVFGDPVVLRRIVDNLLRNAIESLPPPGGSVALDVTRAGDGCVRVSVSDTGCGMSEAELTRAFDDFHTTKSNGTGLGLSVVRRLAADLQANLRVDSEPGRGTTFTLDLPSTQRAGA